MWPPCCLGLTEWQAHGACTAHSFEVVKVFFDSMGDEVHQVHLIRLVGKLNGITRSG